MRGFKEGVREIQSPLGDGNNHSFVPYPRLTPVREIQSPLGDGNICISHTFRKNSLLEKYSPR